jgi:hypothetical protein
MICDNINNLIIFTFLKVLRQIIKDKILTQKETKAIKLNYIMVNRLRSYWFSVK